MKTMMWLGASGIFLATCGWVGAADIPPALAQHGVETPVDGGSTVQRRPAKKVFRPCKVGTLVLLDGKTYADAVITAESPLYVTVRHASGVAQVEKGKLPDELFARFPPDEAGAERAAAREAELRSKAQAERRRRANESRDQQYAAAQRAAALAAEQENAAARQEAQLEALRSRAKAQFTEHFRRNWKPGSNAIYVTRLRVDIVEIQHSPGWEGTYNVKGYVDMEYYLSPGRTFSSMSRDFSGTYTERSGKREVSLDTR